jgi:NADPH-dependent ferric siderophore reductase
MIFHLHGNGPGSRRIAGLRTGDGLFISGPRGIKAYDPDVKQQFIFGDETSLGLACSFLPLLKQNKHEFQFCFELDEENKDVPHLLGLENVTVFPKNGSFRNEKWISRLPVLQTAAWKGADFVLTGNVRSVQALRKVLKQTSPAGIHSQGYWLEGKKGL